MSYKEKIMIMLDKIEDGKMLEYIYRVVKYCFENEK